MRERICVAIEGRRLLSFNIDGLPRTVEPHAYGEGAEGFELLRAFQVARPAESGEPLGWELFRVDQISGIDVLDTTFLSPRPGYERDDRAIKIIFCQL